jgi:hypothetical protein
MSVTDEHRMSPSKILAKTKKAKESEDKDGDKDKKQGGADSPKSNAMLDFISKCKSKAKS